MNFVVQLNLVFELNLDLSINLRSSFKLGTPSVVFDAFDSIIKCSLSCNSQHDYYSNLKYRNEACRRLREIIIRCPS